VDNAAQLTRGRLFPGILRFDIIFEIGADRSGKGIKTDQSTTPDETRGLFF
jgi:phosphoribosylaminoimidazole-succinocarboxamide synthase